MKNASLAPDQVRSLFTDPGKTISLEYLDLSDNNLSCPLGPDFAKILLKVKSVSLRNTKLRNSLQAAVFLKSIGSSKDLILEDLDVSANPDLNVLNYLIIKAKKVLKRCTVSYKKHAANVFIQQYTGNGIGIGSEYFEILC